MERVEIYLPWIFKNNSMTKKSCRVEIKHSLMKINLSYMDMVYYLNLQHEMSFLTRFLQNLLSCSYFTENLVRKSREVDSTAPPTLTAFLAYEASSTNSPPKKSSPESGFPLPFLGPFTSSHRPGGGERWWWCWK